MHVWAQNQGDHDQKKDRCHGSILSASYLIRFAINASPLNAYLYRYNVHRQHENQLRRVHCRNRELHGRLVLSFYAGIGGLRCMTRVSIQGGYGYSILKSCPAVWLVDFGLQC
jgi:hypothetical protein